MTTEAVPDRSPKGLDKGAKAATILRYVLEGKSDAEIAALIGVDRSAIGYWRRRNADVVEPAIQRQERAIEDYAISHKAQRIADLDRLRTGLIASLEEHGITYTEDTRHGSKLHANPAVTELRVTLKQAAEELDQLPRAGISITNQNLVIVKQVRTDTANPEL